MENSLRHKSGIHRLKPVISDRIEPKIGNQVWDEQSWVKVNALLGRKDSNWAVLKSKSGLSESKYTVLQIITNR